MAALTGLIKKLDLARLSLRERLLVIVTLIVVILGYWSYILTPIKQEVMSLRTQKATLQTEIDQGMAQLPILQKRSDELRRAVQGKNISREFSGKLGDILPGGSRLSSVLEELTRLARFRQIEFASVRPDAIQDKGS